MSDIRAIIFDKDGTLFDFAHTWETWAAAFLQRLTDDPMRARALATAIGFDLEVRQFTKDSVAIAGTPLDVAMALSAELPNMNLAQVVDLINEEAETAPQVEAVPLHPFLSDLRARPLRLGVATNDAETPARAHLGSAGVLELFDFIAGCDSGFGAKPAAGQLMAFAETLDLAPAQIVMVGDSTHDLIAAQAAGMRAVGVLTGLAEAETLAPLADVVLPNIGHLPIWLDGASTG